MRLSLGGESGEGLATVFAHEHLVVADLLELEAELERRVERAIDRFERGGLRQRRAVGDRLDPREHVVDEVVPAPTTRLTRPHSSASSALKRRPRRIISF